MTGRNAPAFRDPRTELTATIWRVLATLLKALAILCMALATLLNHSANFCMVFATL